MSDTCPTCLHPVHAEWGCEVVISIPYIWPYHWTNYPCECKWTPIKTEKQEETTPDANHA